MHDPHTSFFIQLMKSLLALLLNSGNQRQADQACVKSSKSTKVASRYSWSGIRGIGFLSSSERFDARATHIQGSG